jgi:hypothetical protein
MNLFKSTAFPLDEERKESTPSPAGHQAAIQAIENLSHEWHEEQFVR